MLMMCQCVSRIDVDSMKGDDMTLGLGIDAGGSYTDAAVMDMRTRQILAQAKIPTTHEDLIMGLMSVLEELISQRSFDPRDIRFVGLSTTLATNSILEGRGGKVGLIGIGWKPEEDWKFDSLINVFIDGGHDVKGRTLSGLDEKGLMEGLESMRDKVDAIVVSAVFSCYNPAHEERARNLIRKHTDLPVVAAHELSRDLGVYERTNTAILNGRLIPIIDDFLEDVRFMLSKQNIEAKIMVLKGDGTMMGMETARIKPVETIMSGPAASALGGRYLADKDNCIVVDMGSTSTDIAYLRKGLPHISDEGATIGDRKTLVKSMDVLTIALGGDSHIRRGKNDTIDIGPKRVVPLALAGLQFPNLPQRIKELRSSTFILPHSTRSTRLEGRDAEIMIWIRHNAPCTREEVYQANKEIVTSRGIIDRLMAFGSIIETGLTPTDLMHVDGSFSPGNVECSRLGLITESSLASMSPDQFRYKAIHRIISMLAEGIIKKVLMDETGVKEDGKTLKKIIEIASGNGYMDKLDIRFDLNIPIVGLGGPAHLFMPSLEDRLNVEVILPMNHEVGNAVGTICSKVSEYSAVQIRPLKEGGYEIIAPHQSRIKVQRLHDAIEKAKELAKDDVIRRAVQSGAVNVEVDIEVDENNFNDSSGNRVVDWIEVKARATGDPMGRFKLFEN